MRRVYRRLKSKFTEKETKTDLLKNLVNRYYGKIRLLEQYDLMLAWCLSENEKPSLFRYMKWLPKSIQFKEDRKKREDPGDQDYLKKALQDEEQETRKRLKRFHDGRE